jgi:uncharacterized membrane protein YphA (DoxX/SURF4 family)
MIPFIGFLSPSVVTYTIHEPPDPPADRIDRAEKLVFVSDGFSWNAALFAPFWLAARKLWVMLGVYIAGLLVLVGLLVLFDAHPAMATLLVVAYQLVWGYEADELQRRSLDAKGWSEIATVSGRNRSECERRFFDAWLPSQPILAARTPRADDAKPQPGPAPVTFDASAAEVPPPLWRRVVARSARRLKRPA